MCYLTGPIVAARRFPFLEKSVLPAAFEGEPFVLGADLNDGAGLCGGFWIRAVRGKVVW